MDNGASSYRRFLDGDNSGLGEIIKEYRDGLTLYLNRYTENIHTAEELAEETFVKLYVKKPRLLDSYGTFKTFLYTVGRNMALDYLKKHKNRANTLSFEDAAAIAAELSEVEKEYIRGEDKIILHRALGKIAADYSRVLYLVYFEEFKPEQVSRILGKSAKQTYNLIGHAKQALKAQLEKEGFVYENL